MGKAGRAKQLRARYDTLPYEEQYREVRRAYQGEAEELIDYLGRPMAISAALYHVVRNASLASRRKKVVDMWLAEGVQP